MKLIHLSVAGFLIAANADISEKERRSIMDEIKAELRRETVQKKSEGRKLAGPEFRWYEEQCPEEEPAQEKLGGIQDLDSTTGPSGMDTMWLILCGALVMFMQMGFAMIECGTVRLQSAHHILLKNFMDMCLGTLMWFLIGFGFAYGYTETIQRTAEGCYNAVAEHGNSFIGTTFFAVSNVFHYCDPDQAKWNAYLDTIPVGETVTRSIYEEEFCSYSPMPTVSELNLKDWFFQSQFATTSATIVSGGIAERLSIEGYAIFSVLMTAIIYPIVVAWTWSAPGWGLTAFSSTYYDFAGSGIVHMVGGIGALIGAYFVGPRKGRWEAPEKFHAHSIPLVALGTLTLWFGWYGFNCGSTLGMSDGTTAFKAALAAVNTSLAGSAGGLIVLLWNIYHKSYDLPSMCNGVLSGLVSITAGCANVEPYMALIIGFLGGIVYLLTSALVKRMRIDDVLDAFAVHGACGFFGAFCAVLFDFAKGDNFHGWGGPVYTDLGYAIGVQLLVLVAIMGWTTIWCLLIFAVLARGKFFCETPDKSPVYNYYPDLVADLGSLLENHGEKLANKLSHDDLAAMDRIQRKLKGNEGRDADDDVLSENESPHSPMKDDKEIEEDNQTNSPPKSPRKQSATTVEPTEI